MWWNLRIGRRTLFVTRGAGVWSMFIYVYLTNSQKSKHVCWLVSWVSSALKRPEPWIDYFLFGINRNNFRLNNLMLAYLDMFTKLVVGIRLGGGVCGREVGPHYAAESLSWYSRDRSKHVWTPTSFHSLWITAVSSGDITPSSAELARANSWRASSWQ